ncbi:MAG: hypothetical protein IJI46_07270 [Erysipelotrichaceae bacterium]|nr:hypothetical protein [Erysipelotrichaceae bacterium]
MRNKRAYLGADKKKKDFTFKGDFFSSMKNGKLPINFTLFMILSGISGSFIYILYMLTIKSQMVAMFTGILSCFLPYLFMKTPMLLKRMVDDAMSYKEFVSILQSSLNATNSTREALIITSEQDDLDPQIKKIMNRIISDIRLGDSVEEALGRAIELSDNTFFKMTLTILKINHNVGTDKTITALNNIQRSILHCFDDTDEILWKQSSKVQKGDIVYLYVAEPVSAVLYRCEAVEVNIPYAYQDKNVSMKQVMRLKLLKKYGEKEHTFSELNALGIKAVRGPRKISGKVSQKLR